MQHVRPATVLDDQGTTTAAYACARWLVLVSTARARYSPRFGGVHFSTYVRDPPAGMVSSPSAATKLLFADQVHTLVPVPESATTKSYRWPLGNTTFTASPDGFFTVNVS